MPRDGPRQTGLNQSQAWGEQRAGGHMAETLHITFRLCSKENRRREENTNFQQYT